VKRKLKMSKAELVKKLTAAHKKASRLPKPNVIVLNRTVSDALWKHAEPQPKDFDHWLRRIQTLIAKHSTKPRTRGKYKGHGSTDALAWIKELAVEVQADIQRCNRGIGYDENMALASRLGAALFVWYANVHRAKCYDLNRPLCRRIPAYEERKAKINKLFEAVNDDRLMAAIFSNQVFNLPHGLGKSDGTFI
jgi:phenylpyruvate tautomerase PptA (4-oxalocrotonate tautomerase family)